MKFGRVVIRGVGLAGVAFWIGSLGGCGTLRTTDPKRTATEQFLLNQSTEQSVSQLASDPLRDRKVYVDWTYLAKEKDVSDEQLYLVGEVRAKLLMSGVRLVRARDEAQIVL